jgi:hypothetical protein
MNELNLENPVFFNFITGININLQPHKITIALVIPIKVVGKVPSYDKRIFLEREGSLFDKYQIWSHLDLPVYFASFLCIEKFYPIFNKEMKLDHHKIYNYGQGKPQ